MIFARGSKFTIELDDDDESKDKAFAKVPGNKSACTGSLIERIQRFAELGPDGLQYPGQYEYEGDGFFAIKANCGLRAYCWYHRKIRGVVVISHFIYKKRQKLSKADKAKMKSNRENYERSPQP